MTFLEHLTFPSLQTLRAADGGTLQVPNNIFFQKVLKRHATPTLSHPMPASA